MKKSPHLICLASLLLSFTALSSARAEDTLWNLSFKDLKPGAPLAEVPYTPPCTGPQKVTTDATDTLTGAASVGALNSALLYTKGGTANYTPALTLKATSPFNAGVITVNVDLIFDQITPSAEHPVETLLAIPFLNDAGGSDYILTVACSGPDSLIVGGAGLAKGKTVSTFKKGEVAHLKAVLDLNQHTFQAFLNDVALTEPQHDDKKFSAFLGITIRDGTALGGNKGATFTAGIGNLVITHG